jgi:hypothetical protein
MNGFPWPPLSATAVECAVDELIFLERRVQCFCRTL